MCIYTAYNAHVGAKICFISMRAYTVGVYLLATVNIITVSLCGQQSCVSSTVAACHPSLSSAPPRLSVKLIQHRFRQHNTIIVANRLPSSISIKTERAGSWPQITLWHNSLCVRVCADHSYFSEKIWGNKQTRTKKIFLWSYCIVWWQLWFLATKSTNIILEVLLLIRKQQWLFTYSSFHLIKPVSCKS